MFQVLVFSVLGVFAMGELTWKTDSGIKFDEVSATELKSAFNGWKNEFGKVYSSASEEARHYLTFIANWRMIVEWNNQPHVSFKLGNNQFSDLTPREFRYVIHGHEGSCIKKSAFGKKNIESKITTGNIAVSVPDSVDWSAQGKVTAVKNQGQCGSCWAFSTTGSIECRTAIKTGKLVSLSEQQLVDCSRAEGNEGCNGGLMDDAFKYVEKEGGLCTEEAYPYEGRNGLCKAKTCGTKVDPITSYTDVPKKSSSALQAAAAEGCVSVAIEADQQAFQFYKSGILSGRCGTSLDHGVLVVGYGAEGGKKFWKVKNSWGKTWGEEGYVRMCRECGKDMGSGECGILDSASYPVA